jgi:hypothetical protein
MAKTEKKCNYCGKVFLAENKEIRFEISFLPP